MIKPFLRMVGGKAWALKNILPKLNQIEDFKNKPYVEPFLGGGAVALAIINEHPGPMYLSDVDSHLINCYYKVQTDIDGVINYLQELMEKHNSKEGFYIVQEIYNHDLDIDDTQRAAMYIFFNKLSYKGIPRINKKGELKYVYCAPSKVVIDYENLKKVSKALQNATITQCPYNYVIPNAVYYLDPPYEGTFDYSKGTFNVDCFKMFINDLNNQNCKVLCSNLDGFTCPGLKQTIIKKTESLRPKGISKQRIEVLSYNY